MAGRVLVLEVRGEQNESAGAAKWEGQRGDGRRCKFGITLYLLKVVIRASGIVADFPVPHLVYRVFSILGSVNA